MKYLGAIAQGKDLVNKEYVDGKQRIWYGTCTTGASTQTKVVTTTSGDFVLATGNIVYVEMSNSSQYSGVSKLNVDGTGAKEIYDNRFGGNTNGWWLSGEIVEFVYDGTDFIMVDKTTATTTDYGLTKLSSSTSSISESLAATPKAVKAAYDLANGKQDALVSGTNIKTINGQSVLGSGDLTTPDDDTTYTLSKSGSTITLTGSDGSTSSVTDDNDNTTYTLSISGHTITLTPSTGTAQTVTVPDDNTTYTLSISGNVLTLTPSSGTAQTVTIPDDDTTYTITASGNTITLTDSNGNTQTATVSGGGSSLQYTIDAPDSGGNTNNVVQNDVANNVANGGYALAEGYGTTASGEASHSEGFYSMALGDYSHAEGGLDSYSYLAVTASGKASHAEGLGTEADGDYSHAQNLDTKAMSEAQTSIGKYNVADDNDTYALIIGNGTAYNARSNALMVDWNGDIYPQATKMADFVVEQGTSGQWIYTKWNSGKLEQWYVGNPGSYTIGTTRGQLRSGGYISYSYPISFYSDLPSVVVNATLSSDAYVVWAQASDHSTTGIKVRIVASANISANSNYAIHIHAVGKWK